MKRTGTQHGGIATSRLGRWAHTHPRGFRHILNLYPAYRGTGGRVTFIANDWSQMRVKLRLNWRTRNYVGTIFGGSIYGCIDPMFMFMLIHRLGPAYTVWDKGAEVRFRRPGRGTLYAVCRMPDAEITEVKRLLELAEKMDRKYIVDLVDADGQVHATVEKVVNVRKNGPA